MTKYRPTGLAPEISRRASIKVSPQEAVVIRGGFGDYLRGLGYASFTIEQYQRLLLRVAGWLRKHRRYPQMRQLTRELVPRLLQRCLPDRCAETLIGYRKALFHWLRFQGRYAAATPRVGWQPWLEDYLQFIRIHRGVGSSTVEHAADSVRAFLRAQFGHGEADWTQLRPADIWRFAHQHVRGVKPIYAKARLGQVRRFLRFVQMRGACPAQLVAAVPKVAAYGGATPPEILTERQQRDLLRCFRRGLPEGKRDYAMTLCMLNLGLRGVEVIRLRLQDIDWRRRCLTVPPTKTGQGRQLPIPERVLGALRDYVKNGRPRASTFDHLFVRHPRRNGHPLSRCALKDMVQRAYRHCGFPRSWSGTHRLRHTFASRLHQRGADLKPIADLLGHRRLDSANFYTQVAPHALRVLAQPWPR